MSSKHTRFFCQMGLFFFLGFNCTATTHATPAQPTVTSKPAKPAKPYTMSQQLMATQFHIICYSQHPELKKHCENAFLLAKKIETIASDYDKNSEVNQLRNNNYKTSLSPLLKELLQTSLTIAKKTQGAFDPTLGQLTRQWRRSRYTHQALSEKKRQQLLKQTGYEQIQIKNQYLKVQHPKVRLDFGGIAKGFAADKMHDYLKKQNITQVCIIAGGDIRLGDAPPKKKGWLVSVKLPTTQTRQLLLNNCGISTSGDLYQYAEIEGKRHAHILNPTTGQGIEQTISASVIAPTASQSDAWATASCSHPNPKKLLKILAQYPSIQLLRIAKTKKSAKKSTTITINKTSHFPNWH